jgi:hypothetical protein
MAVPTRKGSMAAPVLDGNIRQIRNIQICRQDLEPLLPKEKRKLPSTTINAFAAHLQKVLDNDQEDGDKLIIFSSWLGPLATGEIKESFEGSFEDHVIAAVSHIKS